MNKTTPHIYIATALIIIFLTIYSIGVMRFFESYLKEFLERSDQIIEQTK